MALMSDAIRTERLRLRRLRADDAKTFFNLFANWEVVRWLSSPPWPYTLDDARTFIDAQLQEAPARKDFFAITREDALIGGISLRHGDAAKTPDRSPILGYWLGQPHWGYRYMTEAARSFIGHVFATTAVDTIYTGAFADNAASLRVQEKLGFERDGEMMLHCRPRGERLVHVNTKLARSRFFANVR